MSNTGKDLVYGSGITLTDCGVHVLKGVPGEWRFFTPTGSSRSCRGCRDCRPTVLGLFRCRLQMRSGPRRSGQRQLQCRRWSRRQWERGQAGSAELAGEPRQRRGERVRCERPVVLARLGHHRALDAVGCCPARTASSPPRSGRWALAAAFATRCASATACRAVDVEPARHAGVGAVPGDHRRRVEGGVGGGVAAEQAVDGLRLVARVRASSPRRCPRTC